MSCTFDGINHILKLLSLKITGLLIISSCYLYANDNSVLSVTSDLATARWIGTQEEPIPHDSLFFEDNPAPLFRREFIVNNQIQSAILYITAAGYYSALLNGKKIGRNYLDPAWTNFGKRVYYAEYDLTEDVNHGANCLGVTLGNGFYNPLPMKMWGRLNIRDFLSVGKPIFIARLTIEYSNGQSEDIVTDNSWKFSLGPIRKNSVYLGELYNAGYEIDGWETAGFNDRNWKESVEKEGPGGMLQKAFFPPIQITDKKIPVSITPVSDGAYLVDMGENFTGIYRIHLTGGPGDSISFRFGERIYDNGELNPMTTVAGQIKQPGMGGPGAPAIAWQTDTYIFGHKTDIWYSPEFTFHTYRYMEINGLKQRPLPGDIEGLALNTNVEQNGGFSCSSGLIDSIQNATERTFLANLIGVQSDCPAREKFGYGGDLNATSEAFIYNFDMQNFYRKTVFDWIDAMNDSVFIDTAPFVGIKYCGLSWESAFLITQYNLYLYYNDTTIVKELYDLDLKWMEKVARIHPTGLVDAGLSDHESLEPVPVELTGTSHYLQCARIMERFAACMGDMEHEKKYNELSERLRTILLDRFWNNTVDSPINRQTLFATLLYHDIIPDDEVDAAVDSLLKALSKAPSGHFTTGIFGTKYILEVLSRSSYYDVVYKIVNNIKFPGWGYMIKRGATTLWETWIESDNVYSNCHPMLGSVSEWLFRWLGGIRPDPDHPGFEKYIINPALPEDLTQVGCSYKSPYGEIVSNWKNYGNDRQVFEMKIPEGSIAIVKLPVNERQKVFVVENSSNTSFELDRDKNSESTFELHAGNYTVSVLSVD